MEDDALSFDSSGEKTDDEDSFSASEDDEAMQAALDAIKSRQEALANGPANDAVLTPTRPRERLRKAA